MALVCRVEHEADRARGRGDRSPLILMLGDQQIGEAHGEQVLLERTAAARAECLARRIDAGEEAAARMRNQRVEVARKVTKRIGNGTVQYNWSLSQ